MDISTNCPYYKQIKNYMAMKEHLRNNKNRHNRKEDFWLGWGGYQGCANNLETLELAIILKLKYGIPEGRPKTENLIKRIDCYEATKDNRKEKI